MVYFWVSVDKVFIISAAIRENDSLFSRRNE